MNFRCLQVHEVDRAAGVLSDQTIELAGERSRSRYPKALRRIRYIDRISCMELVFLTNRLDLPALTVAAIYKQRWQIELFFKWIKQNLRIDHFLGNSINAVKSQIWTAVCVHLMAVIVRRKLALQLPLSLMLQIIQVNLWERVDITALIQAATEPAHEHNLDPQIDLL